MNVHRKTEIAPELFQLTIVSIPAEAVWTAVSQV